MNSNKAKTKTKKNTNKDTQKKKMITRDSQKPRAYAMRRFLNPNEKKSESAKICGYSEKTRPAVIESRQSFINAIDELKSLADDCKCSPKNQLDFFQNMRDDKKHSPSSRIESGKEINRMLGYKTPEKVEVEQTGTKNVALVINMIRANGNTSIGEMISQVKKQAESNDISDISTVKEE